MEICKYCKKEFETEKGLNIHKSQIHKKELKKKKEKQKKKEKNKLKELKKKDKIKKQRMKKDISLPDHIEEYFKDSEGSPEAIKSRELFTANKDNIDLKTDLKDEEISLINTMFFNNEILKKAGLNPIYSKFLNKFMRLKVSKDRQSRKEFVGINSMKENEDNISNLNNNLKSLVKSRK